MKKTKGSLFLGFLFVIAILAFILFKFWEFMNNKPLLNEPVRNVVDYETDSNSAKEKLEQMQMERINKLIKD
ncbi:MAG: hypothetical protein WC417_04175 [Candidatus Omnitrophota bacterium]|jgi:hypothetical protein